MIRMILAFALLLITPLLPAPAAAQEAHSDHISIVERGRADAPAVVLIPGLASTSAVLSMTTAGPTSR